jgi:hypothetical protein
MVHRVRLEGGCKVPVGDGLGIPCMERGDGLRLSVGSRLS